MKWSRFAVLLLSLVPFFYVVGWVVWGEVGSDPAAVIVDFFATTALVFLLLTLSVTPFSYFVRGWSIIRYRRMLGLYVFFYAAMHVASYLLFLADWSDITADIYKRPYISVGFLAFLILAMLAATSNKLSMKRLAKNWKKLHRSVYLVAVLVLVHMAWQVRGDYFEVFMYACLIFVLLLIRLPVLTSGRLPVFKKRS